MLSRVLSVLRPDDLKHFAFPALFVFTFSWLVFRLKGDIFTYCRGASICGDFLVVIALPGIVFL